ncbi:MAG: hypothetical protein AB9835_12350 [Eubacteriales bacterium]
MLLTSRFLLLQKEDTAIKRTKRLFLKMITLMLFSALLLPSLSCTGEDNGADTTQTPTVPSTTAGYDPSADESLASLTPLTLDMYSLPSDDKKNAVMIGPGETLGAQFNATTYFDSLEFNCPSWGNSVGSLTLSLYKWEKDYDTTVAAMPVASTRYEDFADNAWLVLETPNTPPGNYVYLLSDSTETVGIWCALSQSGYITTYSNAGYVDGEYMTRINYKYTPKKELGLPVDYLNLETPVTTPPQPEIPTDSPIRTLDVMSDTWSATDALGRTLPDISTAGAVRKDKFVGIFYWTWHYNFTGNTPFNNTAFMKLHPEVKNDYNSPLWDTGTSNQHFWDEPLFGYYDTRDKWVLRRHAEMLADAGVDVVIFDCTNGTFTWRPSYTALLETFAEARADGVKTPQIAFILPFGANDDTAVSLRQLYLDIYRRDKYRNLWFYWEGKPLIMAYPDSLKNRDDLSKEIKEFFTFRPGQPSYTKGQERDDQWGWLSVYPQQVYKNPDGTPEQITVGVAQNHSKELGLTAMNGVNVFGRTYTSKGYDTRENALLYGANLEEQFEYALEVDPEFIFITGWNEWVAGRYEEWCGVKNAFPDQFDETFSRDIEPTKDTLKDNYFYQMVSYIRRFKGVRELPEASGEKSIKLGASGQWDDVSPAYRSYQNNTKARDHGGYAGCYYKNETGRNDIVLSKVARDKDNLYFMVQSSSVLSPKSDKLWMRLLLDIEGYDAPTWEGFQYIVNRTSPSDKATLEKSDGGWTWSEVGGVEYSVNGNTLEMKIPKSLLGITGDKFTVNFKWCDNNLESGDIMDFYQYGDTAPQGRFCYVYKAE